MTDAPFPCPFCGDDPYVITDNSYGACMIGCHCDAEPSLQLPVGQLDELTARWNGKRLRAPTPHYLAIAYRWGQENRHHYFVYCGPNKLTAIQYANQECEHRGGKYGVAVYEFEPASNDYVIEFYAPSSMEEADADGPYHNHRIDFFERLGHFIDSACRTNFIYVPVDSTDTQGRRAEQVEVPEYVMNEHARALEILANWERIEAEQKERRELKKESQPPKDRRNDSQHPTPPMPRMPEQHHASGE